MSMALPVAINGAAVCWRTLLASGSASAFTMRSAYAETWPSRPVRIMVPFAAGSPLPLPARSMAEQLTEALGWQVIVENRGGAGGARLGWEFVASPKSPQTRLKAFGAPTAGCSGDELHKPRNTPPSPASRLAKLNGIGFHENPG